MNTQQTEIDVLKAQVKTLKRMFYGFGCLVVAGIALAATSMQGVPDVIQAKRFLVVDDEGKLMVGLTSDPFGGNLSISNKDGKTVASLSAMPSGGGDLSISNKDEKTVALLCGCSDGGGLTIYNKDEKEVANLYAHPDRGYLNIYNKDEKTVFSAP
jgi:hypothetical protein